MDWIHSKYSFQNQFIINADECRADNPNYGKYNAIFEIESENFDSLTPPKDCLYTILPFVASDGYIWFVLFVFKGKENKDGVMNVNNVPIDIRGIKRAVLLRYITP